jgi:uncharacterized protein YbjT (DUF2867 family)
VSRLAAVVGGRGVIGAAIAGALRAAGWDVVVGTHDPSAAGAGYRHADLFSEESLRRAVDGAEVVVQSAQFPNYPIERPRRRHTFEQFDGAGTERLVAAAVAAGARRYLFVSGVGAGRGSARPYYRAIERGERAVAGSGLEWVCLRPAFVYGPRDRGINRLLRIARRSPVLMVPGSGRQVHQPVYAGDVGCVAARALEPGAPTGVVEVGGPERMTLDAMLHGAFAAAGMRRRLVHVPAPAVRAAGSVLQRLPGPLLTAAAVDFMGEDFVADLSALRSSFDVTLTPYAEGLASYLSPGRTSA